MVQRAPALPRLESLPAEFVLAAVCCRPPGVARDLAVRSAASGVNGRRFGRVIARHRVEGLVRAALDAAEVEPDPAIARDLAQAAREVTVFGLQMAAETCRLQIALDERGIGSLV